MDFFIFSGSDLVERETESGSRATYTHVQNPKT